MTCQGCYALIMLTERPLLSRDEVLLALDPAGRAGTVLFAVSSWVVSSLAVSRSSRAAGAMSTAL